MNRESVCTKLQKEVERTANFRLPHSRSITRRLYRLMAAKRTSVELVKHIYLTD